MSQWGVQLVIGKLITDEAFRRGFETHGGECLYGLSERGIDLNDVEIAALLEADPRLWSKMAGRIDLRLKRTPATSEREGQRPHPPPTVRQRQVLRGVFEGLSNKEIAAHLGVSESAVKATLQKLFRKARVRTRAQLVRVALDGSLSATRRSR
jgi:DNA-binding NarL/FixJ family response regulator